MSKNSKEQGEASVLRSELGNNRKVQMSKYIVVIIFVFLFMIFSLLNSSFMSFSNVISILKQSSFYGIMSLGMMMVVVTAGIDLSMAGILCFTGMLYAYLCQTTMFNLPMGIAAIIALLVATGIGLANGAMVAYLGTPAFIITLATGVITKGLALMMCDGKSISKSLPDGFTNLGKGTIGETGIPYLVVIWIVLIFIIYILMDHTRFGRYVYMVGGNKDAATTSGINVKGTLLRVYAISALLSGITGILMTSRTSSASPVAGAGYELNCVVAVVIGGTSLAGGTGNVWGTLVGVLVIGTLSVGMNVLGVGTYVQDIIQGLIISFAVILDIQIKKGK